MQEILQTLESLAPAVRTHEGCQDFTYFEVGGGPGVTLEGKWTDKKALEAYMGSREHRALLGAIRILCESHSTHVGGGRG